MPWWMASHAQFFLVPAVDPAAEFSYMTSRGIGKVPSRPNDEGGAGSPTVACGAGDERESTLADAHAPFTTEIGQVLQRACKVFGQPEPLCGRARRPQSRRSRRGQARGDAEASAGPPGPAGAAGPPRGSRAVRARRPAWPPAAAHGGASTGGPHDTGGATSGGRCRRRPCALADRGRTDAIQRALGHLQR